MAKKTEIGETGRPHSPDHPPRLGSVSSGTGQDFESRIEMSLGDKTLSRIGATLPYVTCTPFRRLFARVIYPLDGRGGQLRFLPPSNTPHYFPLLCIVFAPSPLRFSGPPMTLACGGPSRFQAPCVWLSPLPAEIKRNVTEHAEPNLDALTPFVSFQRTGARLGGLVDK